MSSKNDTVASIDACEEAKGNKRSAYDDNSFNNSDDEAFEKALNSIPLENTSPPKGINQHSINNNISKSITGGTMLCNCLVLF